MSTYYRHLLEFIKNNTFPDILLDFEDQEYVR